jgi:hypothetical protein
VYACSRRLIALGGYMPRLEGMKSNAGLNAALAAVLLLALFWALEFMGVVDIIPGYGNALNF